MNNKYNILCVDDEQHNLDALRRTLRKDYKVITALSGPEGLKILHEEDISLIITDQRMPEMSGVEFLDKSMAYCPDIVRIILTGFTDVEDLIGAINTGRVYRYITKPWDPNDLKVTIKRAIESLILSRENKKLIDDIIRLEKLATVGQVASGIAHEVKNQLSVLMGVQLLCNHLPDDELVSQVVDNVINARDRIVSILDEIKSYGKQSKEVLNRDNIEISQLFDETIQIVSLDPEVKGFEFDVSVPDNISVSCDKDKIVQVLINLIRNGAHAMDKKDPIRITGTESNNRIFLSVADTGCGISRDNLEKIWEPFYSTKGDKGTGLGLQICKRIVEAHGGELSCESELGEGTTFTIALPL